MDYTPQQVEELVKRLYQPGNLSEISRIDDELKRLQSLPQGWQLADSLLQSNDVNVRFFGALTFQVKLNNEGSQLEPETAESVLAQLLQWTVRLQNAGEGQLVLKKLLATLATYYVRCPQPWRHPLLRLAMSFSRPDETLPDDIPNEAEVLGRLLPALAEPQVLLLLWLASSLATECKKVDARSSSGMNVHKQMESDVGPSSAIIKYALTLSASPNAAKIRAESLACFLNWVNYAQPKWSISHDGLQELRSLVPSLIPLITDGDLQHEACDVFRDILEGYSAFFHADHMQQLGTMITSQVGVRLLEGLRLQEPEILPVAQLVIAYGTAIVQSIVKEPDSAECQKILQLEFAILETPGHPGDDDEISTHSIEFWNTYIEYINDEAYGEDEGGSHPPWLTYSKTVCARLVERLLSKMCSPEAETSQNWTDAEEEGFREFRMDASDLMLSVCQQLGDEMAGLFTSTALRCIETKSWREAEASIYCLNKLSDNVMELDRADALLQQIFRSSLFRDVADFSQHIPARTRKAAIDLLGAYDDYIQHHAEFLPDTLRFLFASLETPDFANAAAKSIGELCSTCRSSLTGELDGFLAHYSNFARSPTSDSYATEKVIGAVAAIIEALSPEEAKARPLAALLDTVESMINAVTSLLHGSDRDGAHEMCLLVLRCLTSVGKGLQAPEESAIELDVEKSRAKDGNSSFWHSLDGQGVQARVLNCCYAILRLFPASGEVIDGFCQVLKTGFPETRPGPFVFPAEVIVHFMEQCTLQTPQLEAVLSITSTFVTQNQAVKKQTAETYIARVYRKVVSIMEVLRSPSNDPAVAQNCLEVLNRILDGSTRVVFSPDAGSDALILLAMQFSLGAIGGVDLLPKRAAAEFWSKVIRLTTPSTDALVRERVNQVMTSFGPALCQCLVFQITGLAMRSELDQLCAPLGALVQTQPKARTWLENALFDARLTTSVNPRVGEAEKRRFLAALIKVRGAGRETKELVKSFYAACRGTVQSFNP